MTTTYNMFACASVYAARLGWYVFPVHLPIFNEAGDCTGCTCEHYRRSKQCERNHPNLYLGPNGKCAQPGKCPAVRWADKSTIDPAQILKWWGHPRRTVDVETGRPYAYIPNIAVDCGKSGLLALDADTYKKTYGDLADLLTWDERQTVTAITGGGGEHLIYDRQGKPYGNATRGLPSGIDVRGAGGYIVVAPSLHKSGRRYRFEEGYSPRLIDPLPIPPALDAILAAATPHRPKRGEVCATTPALLRRSVRTVERLLEQAEAIDHSGQMGYGAGFRWVLYDCPFNPEDDPHRADASAFVVVLENGAIAAGCHHNRCQKRIEGAGSGWGLLCDLVGYVRRRACLVEVTI